MFSGVQYKLVGTWTCQQKISRMSGFLRSEVGPGDSGASIAYKLTTIASRLCASYCGRANLV